MSCLLLIDFSSLIWKASAVHAHLSYRGEFTGGLYGVVTQIASAALAVNATRVAICVDAPPYDRLRSYPEYKGDRTISKDDSLVIKAASAKAQCRELFYVIGVPVWEMAGLEADDMIAWGVTLHQSRFDRIIAASNDSDLFQLFRFTKFAMHRGRKGEYTKHDFASEFPGVTPDDWVTISALTGTHNGVKGLLGVGPKTAMKLLRDPDSLEQVWSANREMLDRNRDLIRLPWVHKMPTHLPYVVPLDFSVRKLVSFLSKYGIIATSPMVEAFSRVCGR